MAIFSNAGLQFNPAFAAVDPTSGTASSFYVNIGESSGGPINSFFLSNTTLYLGGAFSGGADNSGHPFLAAFSLNDPTIVGLNPNLAGAGGPAFTLTVTGTNFNKDSVVNWNGSPRPTTAVSLTLTAAIPATDIAAAGTAQVTVVTASTSRPPEFGQQWWDHSAVTA